MQNNGAPMGMTRQGSPGHLFTPVNSNLHAQQQQFGPPPSQLSMQYQSSSSLQQFSPPPTSQHLYPGQQFSPPPTSQHLFPGQQFFLVRPNCQSHPVFAPTTALQHQQLVMSQRYAPPQQAYMPRVQQETTEQFATPGATVTRMMSPPLGSPTVMLLSSFNLFFTAWLSK